MIKVVRVVVLTAVVATWQVTPALAGSLLQSATRLAAQAGRQMPEPTGAHPRQSAEAQPGTVAERGMSKRNKVLIVIIGALGVAGGMWAIDHGVLDNTPSSKGTRKD